MNGTTHEVIAGRIVSDVGADSFGMARDIVKPVIVSQSRARIDLWHA
jgi:hypothetical protein